MTNFTADTAQQAPGSSPDAAVSALVAAVGVFVKTLAGDVPFGGGAYVLERIRAVHEQVDHLTFAMLVPLAQMESSGELLEAGGQKTLKAYLAHAWGIPHGEAERLMYLAQNLHNETLPQTAAALEEGTMTIGEAAAIASGAEREVKKRDAKANPDADEYRSRIDTGLAGAECPEACHVGQDPDLHRPRPRARVEPRPAGEERRGGLRRAGCASAYHLRRVVHVRGLGSSSDGERLKAALASFTAPYGATEKTPGTNGATASGGTGSDIGLIPAGESVTSRYARTYDALICATGFAHGHHGHTTSTGNGGSFADVAPADADTGSIDAAGASDGPAGAAAGGGCSQPPGTKAVINITVPLSALLGFGFAFNNETNANSVNGIGANGAATGGAGFAAPGATVPGPEPGGGSTGIATGPPSTTPDFPGYPGSPGMPGATGSPESPITVVRSIPLAWR